jgi:hypothetical protein
MDAAELANLVPGFLMARHLEWEDVEKNVMSLRADLIYTDLMDSENLAQFPRILEAMDEERCYIVNHELVSNPQKHAGRVMGIEITQGSNPDQIKYELSNEGPNHHKFLSVFYFVGWHGIVSATGRWFIVARTDDRAAFTSTDDITYSVFNKIWWPSVRRYEI